MAADEVLVRSIEAGRTEVTVDGWRVPGVRSVQVTKRVHDMDVVTIELRVQRVTMLPLEQPPTGAHTGHQDTGERRRRTDD